MNKIFTGILFVLGLVCLTLAGGLDSYWKDLNLRTSESWGRSLLHYRALNIGHPANRETPGNTIPAEASAVTAMVSGTDGLVYGATSGVYPDAKGQLFQVNLPRLICGPLWELPKKLGKERFFKTLVQNKKTGVIFGGTSNFEEFGIGLYDPEMFKHPDHFIKKDYAGGRVFSFNQKDYGVDNKITDIGVVKKHHGIRTMVISKDRSKLYGLLEPSYEFFILDIKRKKSKVISIPGISWDKEHENNFRRGHSLARDSLGFVYGAASRGQIFRFNPVSEKIRLLNLFIPGTVSRQEWNTVDAMISDPKTGMIWGGTELDGFLFKFDPYRKKITNYGQVFGRPRIRALTIGADGSLFGFAGDKEVINRFFRFDTKKHSFHLFGGVEALVVRDAESKFRFRSVGVCITHPSTGTILFGESQRMGKVGLYSPTPVSKY